MRTLKSLVNSIIDSILNKHFGVLFEVEPIISNLKYVRNILCTDIL